MPEQAPDYSDQILEGFDPKRGGSPHEVAAYAVKAVKERLKADWNQRFGLGSRSDLVISAWTVDENEPDRYRASVLPTIPAGEIEENLSAIEQLAGDHTSGKGKLVVEGNVLVESGAGRERQTQELLRVPIAKELSGAEILARMRKGP